MSAAQMRLLTAKLTSRELTSLKKQMLRPGFVEEWNSLDALAAGFAKVLLSKKNSSPSVSFKLFMSYDPEAILWLGFTSKDSAVRERYNLFLKVWPEARQRIPYALMQELRITQELAAYNEIVQSVFLELIDGRLTTPEEMRAFLEPYSPPAPPPQVTIKRPRVKRSEAKLREPAHEDDEEAVIVLDDEGLDGIGGDAEIDLGLGLPKVELDHEIGEDVEDELKDEEHVPVLAPVKHAPRKSAQPKPAKGTPPPAPVPVPAPKKAEKAAAAAPVAKSVVKAVAKPVAKAKAKPVVTAKAPAKKPVKAKAKPVVKVKAKPPVKAKSPVKVKAKLVVKVKAPAKKLVKAKAKKPVKSAIKVKATPANSAPAKGKSAPAKKSKAGKAKAKPTAKKAASKSSKKR
jgi:hypothetical protein